MRMSSVEEKDKGILVFRGGGCKFNQNYGGVPEDVHQIISLSYLYSGLIPWWPHNTHPESSRDPQVIHDSNGLFGWIVSLAKAVPFSRRLPSFARDEQSMLGSEMVATFVDPRALGDLQQWSDSVALPKIKLTRNRERPGRFAIYHCRTELRYTGLHCAKHAASTLVWTK